LHRAASLFPLCLLMAAIPASPQIIHKPAEPVPAKPRVEEPQGQLDSNQSIFAVLAAMNAVGYDAEADSPTNHPLRKQLREYIQKLNPDSLSELRRFFRDHKKSNANAELSQYISFALCTNAPDFSYRYDPAVLPPDVQPMTELSPLLAAFYKEAHLDDLWKKVQPVYDQAIAQYQAPIAQAVLQANAYLRNTTSGYLGRRFQIYIDLLGAPNQVQARSYVDDYFIVITPEAELPIDQIRHGYLHYLLDPLALKYSEAVTAKHALGDYANGSPILEEQYKSDFVLLATECFIKAVESRLDRKPAAIDQALREGFVLTPAFAEQLTPYEAQEQSMRLYFRDLVNGIDLKREEKRLDHVDFLTERTSKTVRMVTKEVAPPEPVGAAKTLAAAEKAYTDRDLPRARQAYLQVLKETNEKSIHAKAYYGLARIAVLERDPELGDRLFRKVLELEPDPDTKSWSLLYLGRLADSQGEREQAAQNYKAAIAVEGAPESVRQAAEKGLKEAFVKK
jgi:tetratricopeptide (TPR) repeat protein